MDFIVTGGAGFIGSHLVDLLLSRGDRVLVFDKMTYATSQWSPPSNSADFQLLPVDISDRTKVFAAREPIEEFLKGKNPSIFHLAAESHVDRSIASADPFITTNVLGTQIMLDFSRIINAKRFLHVSTDEVYGSLLEGEASEESPLQPSSAYSASKASSDLVVLAHHRTFGTDVIVTRCVNNFGPRQSLEKFIPRVLSRLIMNRKVPIYGDGSNIREWIYVSDHCEYLISIMTNGESGHIYNIGSNHRKSNLQLARELADHLGLNPEIEMIEDRKGHDQRYALDSSKIRSKVRSIQQENFSYALDETIRYYKNYSRTKNFLEEIAMVEAFYGN